MKVLQMIRRFLGSMKFAVFLLFLLALACAGGSFITQGQSFEWYAAAYSEKIAGAIIMLGLDDVFHSLWFVVITAFLCLNLLLCNIIRLPVLRKRRRAMTDPKALLIRMEAELRQKENTDGPETDEAPGEEAAPAGDSRSIYMTGSRETAAEIFRKMGFSGISSAKTEDGKPYLFAYRHLAGFWGAWLCHLGVLVLIAGFGLGQMTKQEYTVYGVPGQSKPIADLPYGMSIDSFDIGLREDDTVEQYTSQITVYSIGDGSSGSASVSVNHPASLYGMRFYQNSTGWAATISVEKEGKEIQSEVVCAGDYLEVADNEDLVIGFSAFYPDYYMEEGVGPATKSSALNNPGYLYRVYYQKQILGMNILTGGENITIDDYTIIFSDPQPYTLIQIKKDRFTPVALAGGLLILLSLLLAFYIQPARLLAMETKDGWAVLGECQRGGALFAEKLSETVRGESKEH